MPNLKPKRIKTYEELKRGITPMLPGQPEMIPWVWYDKQTFTSGTTTELEFFTVVQSNKANGNMEAAGQIPAPMFFDLYHLGVAFQLGTLDVAIPAAGTVAGAVNDLVNLCYRGIVELQIAQKVYYRAPIFMCPAGGGVYARIAATGTYTATDGDYFTVANNGVPDVRNKNNFFGMITIPHNQSFFVKLIWDSALTLQASQIAVVVFLEGYLYRRVL
jgi:hypothetical protein